MPGAMAAKKDDGYVRFRCKACGQKLKIKDTLEGGNVMPCPRCGENVNVPLANLEAIAEATAMAETGQPGRLNVNPELLRERLRGEGEKAAGPGSVGGAPTLRGMSWSPEAAFGRIEELDQLGAALGKMEQDVMGQIQRLYRGQDLSAPERHQQIRDAADHRRDETRRLLESRLATLRQQVQSMEAKQQRLNRSELQHLARLRRAFEAIQLYGRYVLGIEV